MRALVLVMLTACADAATPSPPKAPIPPAATVAAPSAAPIQPAPKSPDDETRVRERALEALSEAHLTQLNVADRPTRIDGNRWELGAQSDGWSGSLVVNLDDGRVTIRDLQQDWSLDAWPDIRARANALSEWLGTLRFVQRFCKQAGCVMWVEEAPAPDCSTHCSWSAYLGISNGTMTLRHFTLRIDERKRTAIAVNLEGREQRIAP